MPGRGLPEPAFTPPLDAAPDGPGWLNEIKFDGYRMHARLDHGAVKLLTRTGLDWTHKYPAIASAVSSLGTSQAYLDGELRGLRPKAASDAGNAAALVFFLFDLLFLNGKAKEQGVGVRVIATGARRAGGRTESSR
jgi:ATP-dependent DNA ligase